jgi:hypothetical protein
MVGAGPHIKHDPISKITNIKRAGRVAQVGDLEFNSKYHKKRVRKNFFNKEL